MDFVRRIELRTVDEARKRLRVAVTRNCNLRCFFCHGDGERVRHYAAEDSPLSPQEFAQVIRLASTCGVDSVKLTGGEPLLYTHGHSGVVRLVEEGAYAANSSGVDLSMVSNATQLSADLARDLKNAGLSRITLSLHAASDGLFQRYAGPRSATVGTVVEGIQHAVGAGLRPVKMNSVIYHSRRNPELSSLHEMKALLDLAGTLGVDELRFYVVVANPRLSPSSHEDVFVYWDDPLLESVFPVTLIAQIRQVVCDPVMAEQVMPGSFRATFRFADRATYPEVSFQNLGLRAGPTPDGRCECQEGSYAMRLLTDGQLKACLFDRAPRFLLDALRSGDLAQCRRMMLECQMAIHEDTPILVVTPESAPSHAHCPVV